MRSLTPLAGFSLVFLISQSASEADRPWYFLQIFFARIKEEEEEYRIDLLT